MTRRLGARKLVGMDIRERLQAAARRLADHRERMRSLREEEERLIAERDALIAEALEYKIRPEVVIEDSGVSRSRVYQIRQTWIKQKAGT